MTEQRSGSILVWNGLVAPGVPRMEEGNNPVPTGTPPGEPGRPDCPFPDAQAMQGCQTNGEFAGEPN